ncbi:divergent CRAL/TRIO domain-containing protein [Pyrenochaeta sp. MPI-SDFR-AT-0127]|nr:divergent CRAL/TRIO domain-containing protein [Pyrenochaeta sp. MPI-SDFR-AT-0127]
MSGMRAHIASRLRSSSLSAVPPSRQSSEYSGNLAKIAASVLYRSPLPSKEGRPVFILNAAALPDSHEADYDSLLPYVLARLPEEDELLKGFEYEVVFFAGDGDTSATSKKHRPGWGWFLQAYHVLSRAMRKRLQKLYIVHEKAWVRILTEIFSTIVSPKFRRKIYHLSSLTSLALQIPIENLLIPPSTYLTDRRVSDDIFAPYATGKRAFAARNPFPTSGSGRTRFPRVLRETTSFLLLEPNITSEGIFRVPPNSKLRDVLKEAYDRGQKYIIWKDNEVTLPVPPYSNAEHQDDILAEVDPRDSYSVFMAAALVKAWYASLRQPIFPQTSYTDLKRLYGDSDDVPDIDRLRDLFSPASEWSLLPVLSRDIVVRHLLPLLNLVAARQEQNKMTAENLAVCFAPALLCGPDQLEDAKMSSIIRRIFTQAIDLWSEGLREACGQSADVFHEELKLPKDEYEWDDPVEAKKASLGGRESLEEQTQGITLEDNEKLSVYSEPHSDHEEIPPPLPPRSREPTTKSSADSTKRKPAPPLAVPPRYSSVISDAPEDVAESPSTYAATTDGFAPRRADDDQGPPLPPRWNSVTDEKKSGMSNPVSVSASARYHAQDDPPCPVTAFASKLSLPKRKTLTATQIDNVGNPVATQDEGRRVSEVQGLGSGRVVQGGFALPGLTVRPNSNSGAKRAPSVSPTQSETQSITPKSAVSETSADFGFRRPSIPASASRTPSINSLARPVYPGAPQNSLPSRPVSKSTSLPIPASTPRLRAPSPGLLQRMPSFEKTQQQDDPPCPVRKMFTPKKLNLKKQSVDDLRRLYEERAGTASALVEAGRVRYA